MLQGRARGICYGGFENQKKYFRRAVGFLEGTVVGYLQYQVKQIKLLVSRANVHNGPYRLGE